MARLAQAPLFSAVVLGGYCDDRRVFFDPHGRANATAMAATLQLRARGGELTTSGNTTGGLAKLCPAHNLLDR
eukprot:SAG11_NODE_105_length_16528_cov_4.337635_10_plen_73_part_00